MFYERQVNCLTQPERSIVEVFRVLVFGLMVNPCPKSIYDTLWSTATWGIEQRKEVFERAFELVIVTIDDFEFVVTLLPLWFIAYNEAVEAGEVVITDPCPCVDF
mgnify:CR=1 FL=1